MLANCAEKCFEDAATHFGSVPGALERGAGMHHMIGNSSFCVTLARSGQACAEMPGKCGFSNVEVRPVRKRNSKKGLAEFGASATRNYAAD